MISLKQANKLIAKLHIAIVKKANRHKHSGAAAILPGAAGILSGADLLVHTVLVLKANHSLRVPLNKTTKKTH